MRKKELFRAIEENAAFVTLGNLKLIENLTDTFPSEVVLLAVPLKETMATNSIRRTRHSCKSTSCERSSCFRNCDCCWSWRWNIYIYGRGCRTILQWENTFEPITENHELYKEFYETWKTVYNSQLTLADKGLTTHMWIAPGAL